MKTIIILIIFFTGITFAQSIDSSQIKKEKKEQNQFQNQNQDQQKYQNKDQIGPKENPQGKGKIERKRKDVFIDKDGDGICDNRQSGMSFNKMRKRFGAGKKGPGSSGGNGSGGNQNGNGGR
jgi:type II secretory pathway pseudopilin PulG